MRNTVFYLIGLPGVGKHAVGRVLAERTGARLVDNHYWANVVLGLVGQDGVTPLDPGIHRQIDIVRDAVMETVAAYSPPEWSFVFTHAAVGEGTARDRKLSRSILAVTERRGARVVVVNLRCSRARLIERLQSPERRMRMKAVDVRIADLVHEADYRPEGFGAAHSLDSSDLAPAEVVRRILALIGAGS